MRGQEGDGLGLPCENYLFYEKNPARKHQGGVGGGGGLTIKMEIRLISHRPGFPLMTPSHGNRGKAFLRGLLCEKLPAFNVYGAFRNTGKSAFWGSLRTYFERLPSPKGDFWQIKKTRIDRNYSVISDVSWSRWSHKDRIENGLVRSTFLSKQGLSSCSNVRTSVIKGDFFLAIY